MTTELDIAYLKANIQTILNKVHSNSTKRVIKQKFDRLSFACPICGDSHSNNSEKRGHLFLNNLYYKCYNEDCRSTFTKLCKDFEIQLDPTKRLELINYIDSNFQVFKQNEDNYIQDNLAKLIKFEDLQSWMDNGLGPVRAFKPVQFGSKVYNYLINRGIPKELINNQFYEGIKQIGKYSEATVLFINRINDKVIGMQERNLESGIKRKFKIWTFQEMYKSIYEEDIDIIEAIGYNKLSYLYNILAVDFEQIITIFEGFLDSLFMPNTIGAVGINTDFGFLIHNDLSLRFFFDNDNIGKRKSLGWLRKGYPVFLWEKLRNDLAKKAPDPHIFKNWFDKNIKDLNVLYKEYKMNYRDLEKYFSTSKFDSMYLTVTPYTKNKQIKETNIYNVDWNKKINELLK